MSDICAPWAGASERERHTQRVHSRAERQVMLET